VNSSLLSTPGACRFPLGWRGILISIRGGPIIDRGRIEQFEAARESV
jgi:hypothetical protein